MPITGTDIHDLMQAGNSETAEIKSLIQDPTSVAMYISAFANGGGGRLVVGLRERSSFVYAITVLPYRLKAAASHTLLFRGPTDQGLARAGSATVNVGLGNPGG